MNAIDIHTHGIGGYDTQTGDAENILRIAEIHASAGVSEILLAVYPAPLQKMRLYMAAVKEAIQKQQSASDTSNLVHRTSRIAGIHIEGPFLNPAFCGALDPQAFIDPTEYNLSALIEGFEDIIKVMTIAPEMNNAPRIIRSISNRGIVASMGHSGATYAEAEAGFHAGAQGITHIFNAMQGFHHREPGIAGFGLVNQDMFIEVIGDPHHLHEQTIDLIFRMKSPEKIILISDSVKETGSTDREMVNKNGRLLGGNMTVAETAKRLIEKGYDSALVTKCITENPRKYLSIQ